MGWESTVVNVSWDLFVLATTIEAGCLAGLFWLHNRAVSTLHGRASHLGKQLDDYKLEAAKEFASYKHLRELEERLVKAVDTISQDIRALTRAMQDHLIASNGEHNYGSKGREKQQSGEY